VVQLSAGLSPYRFSDPLLIKQNRQAHHLAVFESIGFSVRRELSQQSYPPVERIERIDGSCNTYALAYGTAVVIEKA
jgi:hypothetical protein